MVMSQKVFLTGFLKENIGYQFDDVRCWLATGKQWLSINLKTCW